MPPSVWLSVWVPGREASDPSDYRVTDGSGKKVVERSERVRTNFYSQGAE